MWKRREAKNDHGEDEATAEGKMKGITKEAKREVTEETGKGQKASSKTASRTPAGDSEGEEDAEGSRVKAEDLKESRKTAEEDKETKPCGNPPEVKEALLSLLNMSYGHAWCSPGHVTSNKEDKLTLACVDGKWHSSDTVGTVPMTCVPDKSKNSCPETPTIMNAIVIRKNATEAEVICDDGFSVPFLDVGNATLRCVYNQWLYNSSLLYGCLPAAADLDCGSQVDNSTNYMMNSTYGFVECNEGFTSSSGKFWTPFACRDGERIFDLADGAPEMACLPDEPCKEEHFPQLRNGQVLYFSGLEGWCDEGYRFPSGDTSYLYACIGGAWQLPTSQREGCLPYCSESCQNGGTCTAPDFCNCPPEFTGTTCMEIALSEPMPVVSHVGNRLVGLKDGNKLLTSSNEGVAEASSEDVSAVGDTMVFLDNDKILAPSYRDGKTNSQDVPAFGNRRPMPANDKHFVPSYGNIARPSNKDVPTAGNMRSMPNNDKHFVPSYGYRTKTSNMRSRLDRDKPLIPSYKEVAETSIEDRSTTRNRTSRPAMLHDDKPVVMPSYRVAETSSKGMPAVGKRISREGLLYDDKLLTPSGGEVAETNNKDVSTFGDMMPWLEEGKHLMPSYKEVAEANSQGIASVASMMPELDAYQLRKPSYEDFLETSGRNDPVVGNVMPRVFDYHLIPKYKEAEAGIEDLSSRDVNARNNMATDFQSSLFASDDLQPGALGFHSRPMPYSILNRGQDFFPVEGEFQSYQASPRRVRQLDDADRVPERELPIARVTKSSGEEDLSTSNTPVIDESTNKPPEADDSTTNKTPETDDSTMKTPETDDSTTNKPPETDDPTLKTPENDDSATNKPPETDDSKTNKPPETDDSTNKTPQTDYSTPEGEAALPTGSPKNNPSALGVEGSLPEGNRGSDYSTPRGEEASVSGVPLPRLTTQFGLLLDSESESNTSLTAVSETPIKVYYQSGSASSVKMLNSSKDSEGECCEILKCESLSIDAYNAALRLSENSSTVTCREGYTFAGGETSLRIECYGSEWVLQEPYRNMTEVTCQAVCDPPCNSTGKCIEPDVCRCAEEYTGDQCQFLKCLSPPPHVKFAEIEYKGMTSIAKCLKGYTLPNGNQTLNIECIDGQWLPAFCEEELDRRLECLPVCQQECRNKGKCVAPNTCACPMPYDGPTCRDIRSNHCKVPPPIVKKAYMNYTVTLGEAVCIDGYALPTGETTVRFVCNYGEWKFSPPTDLRDPECQPVCVGGCQNGGVCVDANRCRCPRPYRGPLCQDVATDVCPQPPAPFPNSIMHMSPRGPYVTCRVGYAFPSGETQMELWCQDNTWVPATYSDPSGVPRLIEADGTFHLACLPTCNPPCLNHGKCIDVNVCHCTKPYTGEYCQDLDEGHCWDEPPSFENAYTVYNSSRAAVTCKDGYVTQTTEPQLFLECSDGDWKLPPSTEEPICLPSCVPPCDNGGECVAPNTCECTPEFYGALCEKKRCPTVPEAAPNSYVSTDTRGSALVSCFEGYIMNTGTNEVPMKCLEGEWLTVEPQPRTVESLECRPFCAQMCLNGGTCTAPNLCDCPEGFAGRYCQHLRCNGTLANDKVAEVKISPDLMTAEVTCRGAYRPSTGNEKVLFYCENGHWQAPQAMLLSQGIITCVPLVPQGLCQRGQMRGPEHLSVPSWLHRYMRNNDPILHPLFLSLGNNDPILHPLFLRLRNNDSILHPLFLRYSHTIDGHPCTFPFIYNGLWYKSCTDIDSTRPWCATGVTVHNAVSSWGVCVSDLGTSKVVMTVDGLLCNLPFTYNGVKYETCISTTDRPKPWCATEVDGSGSVTKWSLCDPSWGVTTAIITTGGRMCTFPFIHNGNTYNRCVDDVLEQNEYPWCATEVSDGGSPWLWAFASWIGVSFSYTRTISTEQHRVCQFPFVWKNQTVHTCLPAAKGMNGPWCATKVDGKRNMLEWDLCVLDGDKIRVQLPHQSGLPSISGPRPGDFTAWHLINITTVVGVPCVIPFMHKGRMHNGCVKEGNDPPWCATAVDERLHVMAMGICPSNWDLPKNLLQTDRPQDLQRPGTPEENMIYTETGKVCILPFTYEGIQYHGCISVGSSKPFCASEVDSKGELTKREDCPDDWDSNAPLEEEPVIIAPPTKTVSGESCIFPFYYNGKLYQKCITVQSYGPFCATKVDDNQQALKTDLCQDGKNTSAPGKFVINYRTPIITASGEVCVFPFVYEGREFYGCVALRDQSGFICAIRVDHKNEALTFDYCPLNWDYKEQFIVATPPKVLTLTGEPCVLPFRYKGALQNGCVSEGHEEPFCATKVDGELNLLERRYCPMDWFKPSAPPPTGGGATAGPIRHIETVGGESCVIPFYFLGKEYHGCVVDGERRPFCATQVDANGALVEKDDCVEDWYKAIPPVEGYLPPVYTKDKQTCVNSYKYNGGQYFGCIQTGSARPFCATAVDQNKDLVSHGSCSEEWERSKYTVTTEKGKKCIFPFTYKGVTSKGCVSTAEFRKPFCATQVDEHGRSVEIDFCPPDWEMMLVFPGEVRTEFGAPCVFPFRYRGRTYRSCTFNNSFRAWCATAVDDDRKQSDWGYCIGLDEAKPDRPPGSTLGGTPGVIPPAHPPGNSDNKGPLDYEAFPGLPTGSPVLLSTSGEDHNRDCRHIKTISNQMCVLPFKYRGRFHNECITLMEDGPSSCAVRVDVHGAVVEWGICQPGSYEDQDSPRTSQKSLQSWETSLRITTTQFYEWSRILVNELYSNLSGLSFINKRRFFFLFFFAFL
ncbi:uncharacterized protein [Macrobrachium rosenbergii]|uniref:uncharacterized protein n=1 Tax=Macrobrachium rosenbergii TaxID=79674 RepID=UPI0034D4EBDE